MNGDEACAEGALAAGCRFFGGYPITPATEVAETMAKRLPAVGGIFIQMEDEIASIAAVLGAASDYALRGKTHICTLSQFFQYTRSSQRSSRLTATRRRLPKNGQMP